MTIVCHVERLSMLCYIFTANKKTHLQEPEKSKHTYMHSDEHQNLNIYHLPFSIMTMIDCTSFWQKYFWIKVLVFVIPKSITKKKNHTWNLQCNNFPSFTSKILGVFELNRTEPKKQLIYEMNMEHKHGFYFYKKTNKKLNWKFFFIHVS